MGLQVDGSLENPGKRVPKVKAEEMRISQAKGQWNMQGAGILPAFVLCQESLASEILFLMQSRERLRLFVHRAAGDNRADKIHTEKD